MAILHSVRLIEVAMFLDFLAVTAAAIVQPYLFVEKFSEDVGLNGTSEGSAQCHNVSDTVHSLQKHVESQASRWAYYTSTAAFVPAIPLALFMGKWSDRYGRRPVLLVGMFGSLLNYAGILLYKELQLPLYTVLLSYLVAGLAGGRLATLAAMLAYIVDDCTTDRRTLRLALAEGILALTFGLGGGAAGFVARYYGLRPVAIAMVALQLSAFLYILLFLKESVDLSAANSDKMSKGVTAFLREMAQLFVAKSSYRCQLWALQAAFLLMLSVYMGTSGIDLLYLRLQPFCYSSDMYGYLVLFKSITYSFFGFIIAPLLMRYAKIGDHALTQLGIFALFLAKLLFAVSFKTSMVFTGMAVSMPIITAPGVLRSIMSKLIDPSQQGTLFALVAALESLAALLGSLTFNNFFSYFVEQDLPLLKQPAGYTYIAMAAVLIPASAAVGYSSWLSRSSSSQYRKLMGINSEATDSRNAEN